jgi:hypothetical protein
LQKDVGSSGEVAKERRKTYRLTRRHLRSCEMQLSWVRLRFQSGFSCHAWKALDSWSSCILANRRKVSKTDTSPQAHKSEKGNRPSLRNVQTDVQQQRAVGWPVAPPAQKSIQGQEEPARAGSTGMPSALSTKKYSPAPRQQQELSQMTSRRRGC